MLNIDVAGLVHDKKFAIHAKDSPIILYLKNFCYVIYLVSCMFQLIQSGLTHSKSYLCQRAKYHASNVMYSDKLAYSLVVTVSHLYTCCIVMYIMNATDGKKTRVTDI